MLPPRYVSTREAARLLMVNEATIKRWCDRGRLICHKTAGGHRRISLDYLVKQISEHALAHHPLLNFPDDKRWLRRAVPARDIHSLREQLPRLLEDNQSALVAQIVLALYETGMPLPDLFDDLLTPVLHRIGHQWAQGELSVAGEHLMTQQIRDALVRLLAAVPVSVNQPERSLHAVCLAPEFEQHDLALKMAQVLLKAHQWQVTFLGAQTPVSTVDDILRENTCRAMIISVTVIPDPNGWLQQLNHLLQLADQYDLQVMPGGQGLQAAATTHPRMVVMHSFHQLDRSLNSFRAEIDHP